MKQRYGKQLTKGKPCPTCGDEMCSVGKHRFHPTGWVCWRCTYGWPNIEDVPRPAGRSVENAPIDFVTADGGAGSNEQPPQSAPANRDGDEGESITKPSGAGGRGPESEAAPEPARPLTAKEIFARARKGVSHEVQSPTTVQL